MNCSVIDCDRVYYARGWCGMHYKRWRALDAYIAARS